MDEKSYFEDNVDIADFNQTIQDKLSIGTEIATVNIKPRETVYEDFSAALENLDPTIRTPKQIQDIIHEGSKILDQQIDIWLCGKIAANNYNLSTIDINISDYILELVPHFLISSLNQFPRNYNLKTISKQKL